MLTRYFFRRRDDADPAARGRFSVLGRMSRTRPADVDPLQANDSPAVGFEGTWRPALKGRLTVLLLGLVAWAFILEARLVQLQVFQHDKYAEMASSQQQSVINSEAIRGDI